MSRLRPDLLLIGLAVAAVAYVTLDLWSQRNAPAWRRFERAWAEDVRRLEASGQLPDAWRDVRELEIIGGTPETRAWLKRVSPPLRVNPRGHHRMDALVVAWREDGTTGVLVQYTLEDAKTKNMRHEISRTLILSRPSAALPWLAR